MKASKDQLRTNLELLMQERSVRSKELSAKTGLLPQNLSKILNGKSVPSLDTIDRIAEALGVSSSQLLSGREFFRVSESRLIQLLSKKLQEALCLKELSDAESERFMALVDRLGGWQKALMLLEEECHFLDKGEKTYREMREQIYRELGETGVSEDAQNGMARKCVQS